MGNRFEIDAYARLASPIHRWEPRVKIVGLFMLIFAFASVQQWVLLPWMLLTVAILYGLSRLPLSYLWHRLQYPGYFIAGVVIFLPFCSGETALWQWGPLVLRQEGLQAMVLVVSRFLAIVITGFVLLGTMPFLQAIQALRSLGLPPLLTDMTLLAYRYLYEIAGMLATMQQAMRLRGWRSPGQTATPATASRWQQLQQTTSHLALLTGTLILRSYEQSERVYKAMRLRGYGQVSPSAGVWANGHLTAIDSGSWGAFGLTLGVAIAFVVAEFILA